MIINQKHLPFCPKYVCEICDYKTSKKSSYSDHLLSAKHQKNAFSNDKSMLSNENLPKICLKFTCENCNKTYKDNSGLWRHKKKCKKEEPEYCDKELIMMLIKENSELKTMMIESQTSTQNMMIEVMKNGIHNNSNNNNTITKTNNSHNKTFNLQFFLNETCKDAMNITEFVNSIQLQLSDLERVGELGYVEGISNIITSNLKALDVTQRPIHCTDKKRETMYVKDEDKWEKEAEEKKKLRKVIKTVSSKNIQMLPTFVKAHPDCKHSDSHFSDQYGQILIESMSNDQENEEKIIRKISEQVTVDKESDQ